MAAPKMTEDSEVFFVFARQMLIHPRCSASRRLASLDILLPRRAEASPHREVSSRFMDVCSHDTGGVAP